MESNEKDSWRRNWLSSINELTSFDLQKKSWLDKTHTNPHWSFIEFMCCYFDDLAIDNNYKYPLEKGWLTKEEFEIIKEWNEALDKYNSPKNNDYDNDAILNDSKWLEILQTGMTMKRKLAERLNEKESEILTEKINYLKFV